MSNDVVLDAQNIVVEYPQPTMRTNTLKELLLRKLRNVHEVRTHRALKGVSLAARRGECVSLVGHNGCGKSTLLKVVAGIIVPTEGTVKLTGRIAPMIELGAGFDPELTGRENVLLSCSLLGLTRGEIRERMDEIKQFAELGNFFEAPVKTYSSGMYMRLGFACSTAIEPDILLIDEILAVGDENFQKKCVDRMHSLKRSGATVVLVTHDLAAVRRLADRVLVIDHGETMFEGTPDEAVGYYRVLMERARMEAMPENLKAEAMRQARLAKSSAGANPAGRPGNGDAQVKKAEIILPEGRAEFRAGDDFRLRLTIDVMKPHDRSPVVGFAVHTPQHVRLFGGNTRTLAADGKDVAKSLQSVGTHVVDFRIDGLSLATGRYAVVAAVHNAALDVTLDHVEPAVEFTVKNQRDPDNFDNDILAVQTKGHVAVCEL